jgi:hypothetical protein
VLSYGRLAAAELPGSPLAERSCRCDEKAQAGAPSRSCLLFGANGLTGGPQDRRLAG